MESLKQRAFVLRKHKSRVLKNPNTPRALARGFLTIGNLKLKNRLFLSPMVDVTDLPYRLICRASGAGMAYTEMLYIDAILHRNSRTLDLMKTCREDKPVGLQITGKNEEEFEKLLEVPELKNFDLIDINCGCPSLRITGNSAGSFLLKNPSKIANMVKVLKKSGLPVTVKIRLGFKKNNVLEVARAIEKAGADALTVHARLAVDGRDVKADWSEIKKVKKALKIPVIGNGDVFSKEDYEKMVEETGVDGVMIARGAIGDPSIFERILKGGEKDLKKNLKLFEKYLKLQKKYYGSRVNLGRVRHIGGKFLRGYDGAASYRLELSRLKSLDEIGELLRKVRKMNLL